LVELLIVVGLLKNLFFQDYVGFQPNLLVVGQVELFKTEWKVFKDLDCSFGV